MSGEIRDEGPTFARALWNAPPLAAGVGTEPGFRWGARYENRAPAAPPAPQFRSELDIGRTAAP